MTEYGEKIQSDYYMLKSIVQEIVEQSINKSKVEDQFQQILDSDEVQKSRQNVPTLRSMDQKDEVTTDQGVTAKDGLEV